jgi:hypothetical protein
MIIGAHSIIYSTTRRNLLHGTVRPHPGQVDARLALHGRERSSDHDPAVVEHQDLVHGGGRLTVL